MTIIALLFASYADVLGRNSIELSLASGATVRDALADIRRFPGGDRLPPAPLVAVNLSYARADQVLSPGDELAIIPPVAGG
jgi:molybdopterin converting factor small subunit